MGAYVLSSVLIAIVCGRHLLAISSNLNIILMGTSAYVLSSVLIVCGRHTVHPANLHLQKF